MMSMNERVVEEYRHLANLIYVSPTTGKHVIAYGWAGPEYTVDPAFVARLDALFPQMGLLPKIK